MDEFDWIEQAAVERNEVKAKPIYAPHTESPSFNGDGQRPGDDFNIKASWADILTAHGWKPVGQSGQTVYWKRPGKDERGWSATTGHCHTQGSGDLLYVFSTSASPFESEKAYSKFSAHTLLNHGGDFKAAAADLKAKGFGDGQQEIKFTRTRPKPKVDAENSSDPLDADATAADLIRNNSTIRWVWEGWIPIGALTILAAEPGVGKTRFCADLLRRICLGMPWPDGSPASLPRGSTALWVPADNQHPELGTIPEAFGFPPECLYLNATRREPMTGTMLDAPDDLKDFEKRIKRVKPALVFIDTSLNATDRSAHKPEDAKAFFVPLQQIAARCDCGIFCVTHLNAGGKPLGRRITGQGRVVIQLEKPDASQEHRRKLYIVKSHSMFPHALGVTMGTHGNEYDMNPPEAAESGRGASSAGGRPSNNEADCDWLRDYLSDGAKRVSNTRNDAEIAGISAKRLYGAKSVLGVVETVIQDKKWWTFTSENYGEV